MSECRTEYKIKMPTRPTGILYLPGVRVYLCSSCGLQWPRRSDRWDSGWELEQQCGHKGKTIRIPDSGIINIVSPCGYRNGSSNSGRISSTDKSVNPTCYSSAS